MKTIAYIIFLFLFGSLYLNAQQEHVVTRGETFETIARKYSITVEELMEANKVSNVCYVGRKLVIPTFGIPLSKDTVLPDYIEKMLISNDKKVLTKDLAATYQVGYALWKKKKYDASIVYLRSAAEDGETRAFFPLADCYLQNDPNKNEDEALFWLQKTVNESKDKSEVIKASALLKEMCKEEETAPNGNSINNDIVSYNNNQNESEQNNPTIATNTKTQIEISEIKDLFDLAYNTPDTEAQTKYDIYMQVIQADPYNNYGYKAPAYNNLGVLYESLGDINNAKICYEYALQANPNYDKAKQNLKNVKAQRRSQFWNNIGNALGVVGQALETINSSHTGGTYNTYQGGGGGSYSSGSNGGGSSNSERICVSCGGSGKCSAQGWADKYRCHGSGRCLHCSNTGTQRDFGITRVCTTCKGTKKCQYCKGSGKCSTCNGRGKR